MSAATATATPGALAAAGAEHEQVRVHVAGELRSVVVDRPDGGVIEHQVELADGHWLPVEADVTLPRSGTVAGTLTVDRARLDAIADSDSPAPAVLDVESVRAASAVTGPLVHHAYVAYVTSVGDYQGLTGADLARRVEEGTQFWVRETDGEIPSFPVEATLPLDSTVATTHDDCGLYSDSAGLWTEAAALFPGVDFDAPGNHLIVLVADECGFGASGAGTSGPGLGSGGSVVARIEDENYRQTIAHELGHNVGLMHANAMSCPADATVECTHDEYADYYDVMSGGLIGFPGVDPSALPALSSVNRSDLGLLGDAEATRVALAETETTSTATYRIAARSASAGLRTVAIADPEHPARTYFVDYRDATGRDAGSYYTSWVLAGGSPAGIGFGPGVVIESDAPDLSSDLWTRPSDGGAVGPLYRGGWLPGQEFTNRSGSVRVHVDDIAAGDHADITVSVSSDLSPVSPAGVPSLKGEPVVGGILTVRPGAWPSGTSFDYRWFLDGVRTAGAGDIFAVQEEDLGASISAVVVASRAGSRPVVARTGALGPVTEPAPEAVLAGPAVVGQEESVTSSGWPDGATLSYRWLLDGTPVGTSSTFRPSPDALGRSLAVEVTGSSSSRAAVTVTSDSAVVAAGTLAAPRPRILGTPRTGAVLKVAAGSWPRGTTLRYRWSADGRLVRGATARTLRLKGAFEGRRIQVRVTGSRPGYRPATSTSRATRPVRH